MPRKPTGRSRGRQLGSGRLGLGTQDKHTRLTLRLPDDLYSRLEAFASGRHFHRGSPQLASVVREAIEHYLGCPDKRLTARVPPVPVHTWQTANRTQEAGDNTRQTSNGVEGCEDNRGQTSQVPAKALETREHDTSQTSNVREEDTEEREHDTRQTANTAHTRPLDALPLGPATSSQPPAVSVLDYDPTKYVLGKLCPMRHEFQDTGKTLLTIGKRRCLLCEAARKRAKYQAAPLA